MGGDISCEINYYGPICQKCQKFFSKSLIDDVCEKCDSFKNTILGLQDRSFFIFSTIYYLSSIVDSLTNFIFSFRMQFSSLEKEKSGIQGLISSHLKQLSCKCWTLSILLDLLIIMILIPIFYHWFLIFCQAPFPEFFH